MSASIQALRRFRGYRQMGVSARLAIGLSALLVLVLAVGLVSLSLGPVDIPVGHVAWIVLSAIGIDVPEFGRTEQLVIEQIRLPRIIVGAAVVWRLGAGRRCQGLFPQSDG